MRIIQWNGLVVCRFNSLCINIPILIAVVCVFDCCILLKWIGIDSINFITFIDFSFIFSYRGRRLTKSIVMYRYYTGGDDRKTKNKFIVSLLGLNVGNAASVLPLMALYRNYFVFVQWNVSSHLLLNNFNKKKGNRI